MHLLGPRKTCVWTPACPLFKDLAVLFLVFLSDAQIRSFEQRFVERDSILVPRSRYVKIVLRMDWETEIDIYATLCIKYVTNENLGLPWWLSGKEPTCQAGDVGLMGQEDPLEKEMATHSSILAWRILWTEEPGGLQSLGLQKNQIWLSE